MSYETGLSMEERVTSLFQPDTLLPEQYLDTFRRKLHLEPEKKLMLAVLEDAVACYAGKLKAPRENPKILRRQAAFWLSVDDWGSPFSFNNVCEALALDPTALRERILSDAKA